MSLIVDVNAWISKKLNNLLSILISTLVLAIFLYTLSRSKSDKQIRKSQKISHLDNISSEDRIEQTRLSLIFKTGEHLSKLLGISQKDITFNGVSNKTWSDTSLECIQPYNNAKPLVSLPERTQLQGWLITWKLAGLNSDTIYQYNTSIKGDWVLCNKNEIPHDIYQDIIPASDTKL